MRRIQLFLALTALLPAYAPAHGAELPAQVDKPAPRADAGLLRIVQDHQWSLTSATDGQAQPIPTLFPADGRPYTLSFSASMLNFQGDCNNFGGGYRINTQGQLEVGPMRATMRACEPALMQADAALAALLSQPLHVAVSWGVPPQLQLQTTSNETLTLQGQATPEALYGPGKIIFLEINAQQLPCRNPRNAQTTCLQAREIGFDEQGLRAATSGPWKPFYEDIEGYTHTPGERNVLRVKRFDRGAASEGAAPAVYVLDLIVETETVPID